jgi:hypothetical protein
MIRTIGIAGFVLAATAAAHCGDATFGAPPSGILPPPVYLAVPGGPGEAPAGTSSQGSPRRAAESTPRLKERQDTSEPGRVAASEPMSILPQTEPTRRTGERAAVPRGRQAHSANPGVRARVAAEERLQASAGVFSALRGSQ